MKTEITDNQNTPASGSNAPTCSLMLDWLLDNLHLITVNIYALYCDEQETPSAGFQSLHVVENGRPWNIKGNHRENLIEAIRAKMDSANVKVMAHPLAGANVDRGVSVEIGWKH